MILCWTADKWQTKGEIGCNVMEQLRGTSMGVVANALVSVLKKNGSLPKEFKLPKKDKKG